MTDVPPPRPNPSRIDPQIDPRMDARIDGRTVPERARTSQTSMWLVFLVLAAVILAAIAFTVDRSTSVVDTAPAEPAATATPDATQTVPAEPATAPTGSDTAGGATPDTATGETTGGTTGTGGATTTP